MPKGAKKTVVVLATSNAGVTVERHRIRPWLWCP